MEFFDMIPIPMLDGVVMHAPFRNTVDGTLCISSHHLILSSRKEGVEELWMLHRNIDLVERRPNGLSGGSIVIKCKDFRVIQLDINSPEEFVQVAACIENLASIEDVRLFYPFFYRHMSPILEDGWTAFTPETEYAHLVNSLADEWKISYVNKDFGVCPTYPSAVVVPKSIDDETIIAAANFREGGRFPVLSYRHEGGARRTLHAGTAEAEYRKTVPLLQPDTDIVIPMLRLHSIQSSVLMRSSQPMTGPNSKRCKEDERLINSVLGPGKRGYIIDTRTQTLAQTAKSRGGGFEVEIHYPQWRRVNKPIDRHNVLLDSLTKLVEACNDSSSSMDRWLSRLDSSNWMTHIKDTLNCACLVAQCLDQEGASVLVHGSEGLDATLLVTSLAQVILNPDCRTVRGMEALVEREWLQAGYPFPLRHNKSAYSTANNGRNKTQAPTFLLFLDCVQQIHQQFPCSFEFSTSFLILLHEHSYYSQYGKFNTPFLGLTSWLRAGWAGSERVGDIELGHHQHPKPQLGKATTKIRSATAPLSGLDHNRFSTFLGTCESDRTSLKLAQQTVSLWSHLNRPEVLQSFLNPMYDPNNKVIWPSVAPMSLTLWSELFLRWVVDQGPQKEAWVTITSLREKDKELRLKACRLRRQLADLQKEAVEVGILAPSLAPPTTLPAEVPSVVALRGPSLGKQHLEDPSVVAFE
uniref:Myotubularin phosphatase domain-containing protein n=1 Tax=Timema poppense TaxID=170557 RepID=A0A7R9DH47_TIMPO|nr:unnamed protein product [Timema poppensis]